MAPPTHEIYDRLGACEARLNDHETRIEENRVDHGDMFTRLNRIERHVAVARSWWIVVLGILSPALGGIVLLLLEKLFR